MRVTNPEIDAGGILSPVEATPSLQESDAENTFT